MFKKSNNLFFLFLIVFVFTAVFFLHKSESIPTFSLKDRYCVVLDAGHGSPDGGAVGLNGTEEKDINLDVVLKLREILENKGIKVVLTREGDSGIFAPNSQTIHEKKVSDMKKRLYIINNSNADLFISVHMNSFTDSKSNGLHVFYSRNHPQAEETAIRIQEKISALTGAKTHAVKTASQSLYLLKNPTPPSVLIECGFLSNPNEEKLLNDENYRAKIAFAIAEAIEDDI